MSWIFSTSIAPFTVASQTSQKTGYEAAKLAIYDEHSYVRSWRSNNQVTAQTIRCTFASAQTLTGIVLLNLNGPVVQLKKSTNGSTFPNDLVTNSTAFSDYTALPYLAYRRLYIPLTTATGVTDVQVIVKAQTPLDGAAYLEMGSVVFLSSVTNFPRPPRLGMQETLVRDYDNSGRRKRAAGPWRSEMDWQMMLRDTSQIDVWKQLALRGEDAFFVIAKSHLTTSAVYLMSYDGAMQFEDQKTYGRVNPKWIELA